MSIVPAEEINFKGVSQIQTFVSFEFGFAVSYLFLLIARKDKKHAHG
jgi:hypothetical protein